MSFSSLTVIELAQVLAGPSVGMFFAELGARVIKVESVPTGGDTTRKWKLPTEDRGSSISAYFSAVNWGKESIAIDLTSRPGRDILWHLTARADIVIVSYKPGDAEALGADYDTLRSHREDLIYGVIDGYGPTNPRNAFDAVLQAETGFMHLTGDSDGPPVKMPVALIDILAAHQLKEGLLIALARRNARGEGGVVRTSLAHTAVASLANQMSGWLVGGVAPERIGSDHPSIAPYGAPYLTADDRYIVLAVGTDAQFSSLCAALGLGPLSVDPRFITNQDRVAYRDALQEALAAAIVQWQSQELVKVLHERQVPAGLVHSIPEVAQSTQANDLLLQSNTGIRGMRTAAFTLSGEPRVESLSAPPRFGQHTLTILEEIGYSPSTIDSLKLTRAIAHS